MNDSQEKQNLNWEQEPEYIDIEDWEYEKLPWHPKLTQEQIVYALEKDIYEPKGPEYNQFLMEMGLKPLEEEKETIDPYPIPIPQPIPSRPIPVPSEPIIPSHHPVEPHFTGGSSVIGGGNSQGVIPTIGGIPINDGTLAVGGGDGQGENPTIDTDPIQSEIPVIRETPIVGEIETLEIHEREKEEQEEEVLKVVRVEKNLKNRITPWLCATAIALMLASGLSIDKPLNMNEVKENSNIVATEQLKYSLTEYIREYGYEDKVVENIIYKFAAEHGFNIGDIMELGQNTDAYYYGNLTGNNITLDGQQAITGFCLYSPSDENVRYEYSFYEDRALDGTPDRTSVGDFENKVNVSIDEFLAKLDTGNYNLDDIRFSLHFGNKGWVDFSELIKVTDEKEIVNVQQLVEVCKEGATYEGMVDDIKSEHISIMSSNGSEVRIPIVDEQNQQIPNGTHVIGSDGREYVISNLETVSESSIEGSDAIEQVEGKSKLKWNILDCELLVGVAPLVAAAGFAIASKLKNKEYAKKPDFFEFENESEYENFKRDFEKARQERNSKFSQTMKRVFYGEELHVSKDLSEEQIQQVYSTITSTHDADYSYTPGDQIRYKNGQVYVVSKDESSLNVTHLVSEIGKENTKSGEGLLTEEVVEQYGGGHRR